MSSHTPTSPVPAYEANPVQLPEKHSPAPDTGMYGAATGLQHSGTTQQTYFQNPAVVSDNMYPHQPISPIASPVQQPQSMVPVKHEYYTSDQPPMQQQQQQQYQQPQQQQQQPQQPQQQYQQQQQQQQQQPQQQYQQLYQTAIPLGNLSEAAAPVDCPVCRQRALTVVERHSGSTTHLWAALACVFCSLGCVPYLITSLKDAQHKCGRCGVLLAVWHKSGRTVVLQHA